LPSLRAIPRRRGARMKQRPHGVSACLMGEVKPEPGGIRFDENWFWRPAHRGHAYRRSIAANLLRTLRKNSFRISRATNVECAIPSLGARDVPVRNERKARKTRSMPRRNPKRASLAVADEDVRVPSLSATSQIQPIPSRFHFYRRQTQAYTLPHQPSTWSLSVDTSEPLIRNGTRQRVRLNSFSVGEE
jgi:hypothetical protein